MKQLSERQIAESKSLFGPAPVLSSEDHNCFESLLDSVITTLAPRDVIELIYIKRFVSETWIIERFNRHGAVAVEQRYRDSLRHEVQRVKLERARKQSQRGSTLANATPADIAHLAALEENMLSADTEIEEILNRKASERDHNLALERSMEFQEQLDNLIAKSTRRRNDALLQLELYRSGLGEWTRQATERALGSEPETITLEATQSPPLALTDESDSDD